MPTLHVIVASTRQGRAGLPIAEWFFAHALADGRFTPELVDLETLNLPMLDEPHHPRLRNYTHAHTRAWSATVDRADAFVFVIPEYNHFAPPALVNVMRSSSASPDSSQYSANAVRTSKRRVSLPMVSSMV